MSYITICPISHSAPYNSVPYITMSYISHFALHHRVPASPCVKYHSVSHRNVLYIMVYTISQRTLYHSVPYITVCPIPHVMLLDVNGTMSHPLKNCGRGESLGTIICSKTVVGVSKGMLPAKYFRPNKASFYIS